MSRRVPPPGACEGTAEAAAREDRLVVSAVHGDGDAMRLLWERHRRWVAAVILSHKPAHEDLEDLLQDVAMTFVSKISTLREPSNLRAWLRAIAVNSARASGRRGRYRPRATPDLDERDAGVSGPPSHDDESRRLMDRVEALPAAYREPLLLRAMQGLRSKQIAAILDIPPATVDTRIARARRMLAEMLDETAAVADAQSARLNGEGRCMS